MTLKVNVETLPNDLAIVKVFDDIGRHVGTIFISYNSINVYQPAITETKVRALPNDKGEKLEALWREQKVKHP